jgi:hypothetical protein
MASPARIRLSSASRAAAGSAGDDNVTRATHESRVKKS